MPTPYLRPKGAEVAKEEICVFAQTNYRNQMRKFGVKLDDRRRHMYVIGKTGMGKTTMLENMVLHDIYAGHGVGIVDPHGDYAEKIVDYIPSWRMNDVVYFNPADIEYPIGFNILEVHSEEQKHLIAAGLMAIFKKIWPDVWSSRMEYILNNTILALLEYPGSTLLGINRLLGDKAYRRKVVKAVKDPVIKAFWQNEFANYPDRYMTEAVAPIQNKIGQFLSSNVIRNMVAQVKSTIDAREIMDSGKIFIMNLAKGRIGEDNSRLLGGMLVTKIQLAAMERVDTPEADRKDFFLYVDEFQNFATPSFANILSEARKYRLGLIMAHQYVKQLDELVADAVFGNVGTIVSFRVGAGDAELLAKEYAPVFLEEQIVNLAKYHIILKLMIDGVASQPFSAITLPPIGSRTGSVEKVVKVSRERYGKERSVIEEKILRWSGMGETTDDDDDSEEGDIDTTEQKNTSRPAPRDFHKNDKPSQSHSDNRKIEPKHSAPHPAPVQDERVEEVKNISLKDLLPRPEKRSDDKHVEPKIAEVKTEVAQPPKFFEPQNSNTPRPVTQGQTSSEHSVVQTGNYAGSQPGVPGTKKKRRRRKKKSGMSYGNNPPTGSYAGNLSSQTQSAPQPVRQSIPQPIVSPQQGNIPTPNNSSQTKTPPTVDEAPPVRKTIKPDQIISFNTTQDHDYDTPDEER